MGREANELRNVIAAGPYTWPALDKVEKTFEEIVKLLADLASDPGFTGEAADAAAGYAESLRGDYLQALRDIEASHRSLDLANAAWATALRKYATFDDPDESIIDNGSEAVAAVLTVGFSVVLDALDVFGDDDDDRGEDGLAQLQSDLDAVPSESYEHNYNTGRIPQSSMPSGPGFGDAPAPYSGYDPGAYSGANPGDYGGVNPDGFAGAGAGLAIDGPGAGISAGGGGGVGGMHGVGSGAGAGPGLGGIGMLGAGVGATAAGAAAVKALAGKGGMMGGGGMGGGAGAEKSSSKRSSSGLKAPELEEDDEKAPRSEGAGAGGRASLPDQG